MPRQEVRNSFRSSEHSIATQLEHMLLSLADSVNSRSYDPESFPWNMVAPDYEMHSDGSGYNACRKADYIDCCRHLTTVYPSFKVQVLGMESHVYTASGYCEVFVSVQSTGGSEVPLRVKQRSVTKHEFRLIGGKKWMTTKQTTILGMRDEIENCEMRSFVEHKGLQIPILRYETDSSDEEWHHSQTDVK